ncbi:MAG: YraN family protein [Candidatus Brocadiaceae bacterium]|nr:YraN family protein [Candidatus Brocadiaceae bacterium]
MALRHLPGILKRLLGGPDAPPDPRAALGRRGEQAAARLLRRTGYRILERNFRTPRGEIDLVAFRRGTLVFVEVRSQTQPAPFDPIYTITPQKQARVVRAAHAYLAGHAGRHPDTALRFDVVTVLFAPDGARQEIRHVEGAFEARIPRRRSS